MANTKAPQITKEQQIEMLTAVASTIAHIGTENRFEPDTEFRLMLSCMGLLAVIESISAELGNVVEQTAKDLAESLGL